MKALQTLLNNHKVQMIHFPDAVLDALRKLANDVYLSSGKTPSLMLSRD